MVYYTNGFTKATVHGQGHQMVEVGGGLEPAPSAALGFYSELWSHAVREYGMAMLFTDFLCYRGPAMGTCGGCQHALPAVVEAEQLWLAGMTRGASDAGAEVQWSGRTQRVLFSSSAAVRQCGSAALAVQHCSTAAATWHKKMPAALMTCGAVSSPPQTARGARRAARRRAALLPLVCAAELHARGWPALAGSQPPKEYGREAQRPRNQLA